MNKIGRVLLRVAIPLLILGTPFVVLFIAQQNIAKQVVVADVPVWAPLQRAPEETIQMVDLEPKWSQIETLELVSSLSGIVTDIYLEPGSPLVSGTPLFEVNAKKVISAPTSNPFFRPLTAADSGADVAQLNVLLQEMGLKHGSGDKFTNATLAGVRALAAIVGVPDAKQVTAFDNTWVLWVPADDLEIMEWKITKGQNLSGENTEILSIAPQIQDLVIQAVPEKSQPIQLSPGSKLTFESTDYFADENGKVPDLEAKIEAEKIGLPKSEQGNAPQDQADQADQEERPAAFVTVINEVSGWNVPNAAIWNNEAGAVCVLVKGTGQPVKGIEVEIRNVDFTTSTVFSDLLEETMSVRLAPPNGERKC